MKSTQKLRVIVHGVTLQDVTKKQVLNMVTGCQYFAVKSAIEALEKMRKTDPAVGLAGTWENVPVQVDMVNPPAQKLVTKGNKKT